MNNKYKYQIIILLKNKSILKTCLLFIILCSAYINIFSQKNDSIKYNIYIRAINDNGNIKLRWAPDDPYAWKVLNKYGYKLERFSMLKDGKLIKNPIKETLGEKITPMPMEEWESMTHDKYAMILAQSLYGNNYNFSSPKNKNLSFINQIKEDKARFSFGLMAADLSFEAAQMAGLAYIDRFVDPNYTYLYKIQSLVPTEKVLVDTGFILIDAGKKRNLTPVEKIEAEATEKTAIISWNAEQYKNVYVGYFIERSLNNIDFEKVNTDIYVPMFNNKERKNRYCYFTDSLEVIDKNYFYRIKGITSFSEEGPYSESISLSARPTLKGEPEIVKTTILENNNVFLKWEFPNNKNTQLKYFLLSADRPDNIFNKIKDLNNNTETNIIQQKSSQYYKIMAIDEYEHYYYSRARLVQLTDSIPPSPPEGLKGNIDTLGNVNISWDPNPEDDVFGYKLFFANKPEREFSQFSDRIIKGNEYNDTVVIKTLTKKLYIKAIAMDRHYNPSGFSKTLILERPDVIPPVTPIFSVRSDSIPVKISWKKSFSDDVEIYSISRKFKTDSAWTSITNVNSNTIEYFDNDISKSGKYTYQLVAVDSAGNRSENPKTFSVFIPAHILPAPLPEINFSVNKKQKTITFSWNKDDNINKIMVYKKTLDLPIKLYKTSQSETSDFLDKDISPGNTYTYQFRFQYKNMAYSDYSDLININY